MFALASFNEKELVDKVNSGEGFRRIQVGIQLDVCKEWSSRFMKGFMVRSESLYCRLDISTSCWRLMIGLIWKRIGL